MKITSDWSSRKIGKERFANTHNDLFEPLEIKFSKERALKLKHEENKGRKFDIITGGSNAVKL